VQCSLRAPTTLPLLRLHQLLTTAQNLDEDEILKRLEKLVLVFKFVEDADVFMKFYRCHCHHRCFYTAPAPTPVTASLRLPGRALSR
jgi:hypothetical protein